MEILFSVISLILSWRIASGAQQIIDSPSAPPAAKSLAAEGKWYAFAVLAISVLMMGGIVAVEATHASRSRRGDAAEDKGR